MSPSPVELTHRLLASWVISGEPLPDHSRRARNLDSGFAPTISGPRVLSLMDLIVHLFKTFSKDFISTVKLVRYDGVTNCYIALVSDFSIRLLFVGVTANGPEGQAFAFCSRRLKTVHVVADLWADRTAVVCP